MDSMMKGVLCFLTVVGAVSVALAQQVSPNCVPAPLAPLTVGMNLGEYKTTLIDYHDSGRYQSDLARVDQEASAYLTKRVDQPSGKLAAVFDIDETSLSNWPLLKVDDFARIANGGCDMNTGPCSFPEWLLKGQDEAIAPTLELYRLSRSKGVTVFFITGRHEVRGTREATEANLRRVGYNDFAGLAMEPADMKVASAACYKTPERAKIEQQGYTIVLNVGDQQSDLAGGHAERTFKLPNPFYYIP